MTNEEIQQGYQDHCKVDTNAPEHLQCPAYYTRDGFFQGALWANKQLVHKPDNPEGITGDELSHQVYGYEFGYKNAIDKACNWMAEHIERETFNRRCILDIIDDFRKALEGSDFVKYVKYENQPIDFKKIRVRAGNVLKDGKWTPNFSPCKNGYSVLTIGDLLRVTREEFMKHPMAGNKVWNILLEDRGEILRELNKLN